MNNIIETLKNLPKVTKVAAITGILVVALIIVAAIAATNTLTMRSVALVDVTNFGEVSNVPRGYRDVVEQYLGDIVRRNENTAGLVFSDALIREGTYDETKANGAVIAKFIVDIPELEYSFAVTVVWMDGMGDEDPEDPDVTVVCPYYSEVIYKNKKCIAESPEQQIKTYLPHYERLSDGQRFGVSLKKYNDELYLAVEVKSCGDTAIAEEAVAATKKWIKSIYMDPNDFAIETVDICGR